MATAPQTTATPANSNQDKVKQAIFDRCEELGRVEGKSATARMLLAEYVVARAKDGDIGNDDAEQIVTRNIVGISGETKAIGGNESTVASRVGDIRNFITLGANKFLDGVDLLDNAKAIMVKIREAREDGKKGRVWSMLLAFAREQNKSPERALKDSEIKKLFEQKIAEERGEAEILWGARTSLNKANEGVEDAKIQDAINLIDDRIAEIGGTRKQQKQAAAAKAREEARGRGEKVREPKPKKIKRS